MKNLKIIIFALIFISTLNSCTKDKQEQFTKNPDKIFSLNTPPDGFGINIRIARHVYNCIRGIGVCGLVPHPEPRPGEWDDRWINGTIKLIYINNDLYAKFDFTDPLPEDDETEFRIDEAYTIDGDIAEYFGCTSITLSEGTYEINYNTNVNGEVLIPVYSYSEL